MEQIKTNVAKNISYHRKRLGLTQLQLAEKLNYSDKAVSKWERGEAVPDVYVMLELSKTFGVTVDEMLSNATPKKKMRRPLAVGSNKAIITLLSVGLVWLVATVCFVALEWAELNWNNWLTFIYALPVSAIVGIVFNVMWGKRIVSTILISALIWTVALSVLLTVPATRIWLIFIMGIPLQALTIIWLFLKRK